MPRRDHRPVSRPHGSGIAGRIAVAAIVSVGTVCLAGSPLYLSSVATAAVQSELAHTCLADVGLRIPMNGGLPDSLVRLDDLTGSIAHTQPGVLTLLTMPVPFVNDTAGTLSRRASLLYRDGQDHNLQRTVAAPGDDEVLAPEWLGAGAPRSVLAGDELTITVVDQKDRVVWMHSVAVVDTYPLVPTRPEPSYWCGLKTLFRSSSGDPADLPTPVLLTTAATIRDAKVRRYAEWEVRPDPHDLTRHDAAVLADRFDQVVIAASRLGKIDTAAFRPPIDGGALRAVVRHAGVAAAVVAGTMAPVRLAGLLASLTLLCAATVLVSRERQRELRLRSLKGQAPWSLGLRVATGAAPAVAAGVAVGTTLAVVAVRVFGPAPQLETAAVRSAVVATLLGALGAFVVVAGVATGWSRTLVDTTARRRSWARYIPWELVPIAAAGAAFARLRRIGGIQQIGAKVAHADFWAQTFPLLAVVAPLCLLLRPLVALLRRWRLAGRRLPPAMMIGLRRSLAEPGVTAAVLLATALAAGSFTLARLLTDSTSVGLAEKASVYLGSDLTMTTSRDAVALPAPFDATGTIVGRSQGHSGSQSIDFLGIDPMTFAAAVDWRDDASSMSLRDLLAAIAVPSGEPVDASRPVRAVVVGGVLPDLHLESLVRRPIDVVPVGTARWFPGYQNGSILVVVDRAALTAAGIATGAEIWLRNPPADAVSRLSAAGVVVRNPRDLSRVFDVTSFLTVRWAYATLSVLGVLVGVVVLLAQLLVLDARRRTRQATHVLTARMGLSRRGEAIGLVSEFAPALVGGAALGVFIGWIVARLAVARLDTLRQFAPPAHVIAHLGAGLPIVIGVIISLGVIVALGFVMIRRTRTMEVMRGTV